jgi:hypothetical protein
LEEKDLTYKQREWLDLSRKVGPGTMTRSEREALEKLYAEMLPREQQELHHYITTTFGKKDPEQPQEAQETPAETEEPVDPIAQMQEKVWHAPSDGLKSAFSRLQTTGTKPPKFRS